MVIQTILQIEPENGSKLPHVNLLEPFEAAVKSCSQKCQMIADRLSTVASSCEAVQDLTSDLMTLKGRVADLTERLASYRQSDSVGDFDAVSLTARLEEMAFGIQKLRDKKRSPILLDLGELPNVNKLIEELDQIVIKGAEIVSTGNDADQPLHSAASNGDKLLVEQLLNSGAQVDAVNSEGMQPLHLAAFEGHSEIVELLLAKGACIDAADDDGQQPLHMAVLGGSKEVVKLLLDRGSRIDAAGREGQLPLHWAATLGLKEVLELLLDRGAKVDAVDKEGVQPLHLAALKGLKVIAELLISRGAKIDIIDFKGRQPIHYANRNGNKELVELLIEKGADRNLLSPQTIRESVNVLIPQLLSKDKCERERAFNFLTGLKADHPEFKELEKTFLPLLKIPDRQVVISAARLLDDRRSGLRQLVLRSLESANTVHAFYEIANGLKIDISGLMVVLTVLENPDFKISNVVGNFFAVSIDFMKLDEASERVLIDGLIDLLSSNFEHVRKNAKWCLSERRWRSDARAALINLHDHPDPEVRAFAVGVYNGPKRLDEL